jgi:hypothetical protein
MKKLAHEMLIDDTPWRFKLQHGVMLMCKCERSTYTSTEDGVMKEMGVLRRIFARNKSGRMAMGEELGKFHPE